MISLICGIQKADLLEVENKNDGYQRLGTVGERSVKRHNVTVK
jgi:hypothetical protein